MMSQLIQKALPKKVVKILQMLVGQSNMTSSKKDYHLKPSRHDQTQLHISSIHNQLTGLIERDHNRMNHLPVMFIIGMNHLISTAEGVTQGP